MEKLGNGEPKKCVENLLAIVRGEVPYDRVRGIGSEIVDMPEDDAKFELEQDALWNIDTYEPRVDADSAEVSAEVGEFGDYKLEVQITAAEEDEDE